MWKVMALLFMLATAGCGEAYRYLKSGEVSWALKHELRDRKAEKIELAKLTKFQWDEFFLFGPYESKEEVCGHLTLSGVECQNEIKDESTDDAEMLMVFRLKGKIVHTEMHIRWHGDFEPDAVQRFTPITAVFLVSPEGKS
ncbi:hypothetical protein GCM10027277_14750 [Pseudoduganella ginsengisoli]|uniref:Lipoprotein n=1 Tax=Pseudoduganella ginsengisoli TaxID=1462440 RepID=A0A6L6PVW3_9BURK|nr:hypothetical protein [Pseudoduganella ginsengisoli]MTW01264.1 hypothetical protein [Pseudoduganella ginsengisoli]